jgi:hypothetical protein
MHWRNIVITLIDEDSRETGRLGCFLKGQNALIFAHKSSELSRIFGDFAKLSHSVRASGSIS